MRTQSSIAADVEMSLFSAYSVSQSFKSGLIRAFTVSRAIVYRAYTGRERYKSIGFFVLAMAHVALGVGSLLESSRSKIVQTVALAILAWSWAFASVKNHPLRGIYTRSAAAAHVDENYALKSGHIRAKVAREALVWQIMMVSIALVLTTFVIGVLVGNLPDTGNSDYDNATDNLSVDIAENIESLGPLVILFILLTMVIVYVFRLRSQGM